jgi:hypothetical protein
MQANGETLLNAYQDNYSFLCRNTLTVFLAGHAKMAQKVYRTFHFDGNHCDFPEQRMTFHIRVH